MPIITHYLLQLIKANIDAIILGCTHYSFFKDAIQEILGDDVLVISQDKVVPHALTRFLAEHQDVEQSISRNHTVEYLVTDINDSFREIANHMSGHEVQLKKVMIAKDI